MAALAPRFADEAGPHYRSSIDAEVGMWLDDAGAFSDMRGTVTTAPGPLSLTGRDPIEGASVTLSFALGATGDRVTVPDGEFRTETAHVSFEGLADLGEPGGIVLVGRIRGGLLPTEDRAKSVALTGGNVLARVDFAELGLAFPSTACSLSPSRGPHR
jgi:hypothetical protein